MELDEVMTALGEHAKETSVSLEGIRIATALNTQSVAQIAETIKPIPERLASVETEVSGLKKENDEQWEQITGTKDSVRDLGVKVAKIPNVKASVAASKTNGSFLNSTNGKYVIWACILIIIGLFSIAGVNMTELVKP